MWSRVTVCNYRSERLQHGKQEQDHHEWQRARHRVVQWRLGSDTAGRDRSQPDYRTNHFTPGTNGERQGTSVDTDVLRHGRRKNEEHVHVNDREWVYEQQIA